MEFYMAISNSALGTALRILYAEGISEVKVRTRLNEKDRLRFYLYIDKDLDEEKTDRLRKMIDNISH